MNRLLVASLAIITVSVSYAPNLAGLYLSIFHSSANEVEAFALPFSLGQETISKSFQGGDQWKGKALNLGIFWPTPELSCLDLSNSWSQIPVSFADRNSVLVVDGSAFERCSEVVLKTVKSDKYNIFGVISGKPSVQDRDSAAYEKKLIEFFTRDIRLLLLVVVFLSLVANYYLANLSAAGFAPENVLERHAAAWGAYLLLSSGVLNPFLPWRGAELAIASLTSYFSAIAHVAPGVDFVLDRLKKKLPPLSAYYVVFLAIIFASNRIDALMIPLVPTAIAVLGVCIYQRRDLEFGIYSLLLLVNAVKLLGVGINPAYLPHIHLAPIFVGLMMATSSLKRLVYASVITKTVVHISKYEKELEYSAHLLDILRQLAEFTNATRSSVLITKGNGCELHEYDRKSDAKSCQSFAALPPVFASVFTSGQPLYLESEGSARSISLHKGQKKLGSGQYSVVPIRRRDRVVGALSVAGLDLANERIEIDTHTRVLKLLSSHAEKVFEDFEQREGLRNHRGLADAIEKLKPSDVQSDEQESLTRLATTLKCQVSVYSYFSQEREYRTVAAINFDSLAEETAQNIRVGENSNNEHGPFLIAVRNKQEIFVNNLSLINEVLSPRTKNFFELARTCSLAILPIVSASDSRVETVLVVQSTQQDFFIDEIPELLKRYVSVLSQSKELSNVRNTARVQSEMLATFVPSKIRDRMMRGEQTLIKSEGFLGCIDIVGSTGFLKRHGNAKFKSLIDSLVLELSRGGVNSARLTAMNWDAFYMHSESIPALIAALDSVQARIDQVQNELDAPHALGFRLCITNGDTSQDFSESEGFRRWTIVGSAMADVCKFEQKIKMYGAGIFLDQKAMEAGELTVGPVLLEMSEPGVYQLRRSGNVGFEVIAA